MFILLKENKIKKGILMLLILQININSNCSKFRNTTEVENKDSVTSNFNKVQNPEPFQKIKIGYKNLELSSPLKKAIKPLIPDNELEESNCDTWIFKETDLNNILKKMEKVDETEWYAICYNYPCYYLGKVSDGSIVYDITINAASYITLSNKQETLIFVAKKKLNFFVKPCNCCE